MANLEIEGEDPRPLIVTACQVLYAAGQADAVWGHVSMRDSSGRGIWLKGSQLGFEEVTVDDVILLSWEGEILAGTAGRHVGILMPHHGITTAADSFGAAVAAAVQLERACQVALLAGADAIPASEEDAVRKRQQSPDRLRTVWSYLSRTVDRD